MKVPEPALAKLHAYVALLRECADLHGGPRNLAEAFHDADRYPEFDEHPDANYVTGAIQGFADALGVPAPDLVAHAQRARRKGRLNPPTSERRTK